MQIFTQERQKYQQILLAELQMVCWTDEENLAVYAAAVPTDKTRPAVFTKYSFGWA